MKKSKPKQITLRLPEGLHTEIKMHVAKNKTSFQKWLLSLIQADLMGGRYIGTDP